MALPIAVSLQLQNYRIVSQTYPKFPYRETVVFYFYNFIALSFSSLQLSIVDIPVNLLDKIPTMQNGILQSSILFQNTATKMKFLFSQEVHTAYEELISLYSNIMNKLISQASDIQANVLEKKIQILLESIVKFNTETRPLLEKELMLS